MRATPRYLMGSVAVLTGVILLATFAPLIAPYGYSQISDASGGFQTQDPPSAKHLWGTTVGGFDVFSRVSAITSIHKSTLDSSSRFAVLA